MKQTPDFLAKAHDPSDPSPWLALYLDSSTPMGEATRRAWLSDSSSRSRQFLLPIVRPLARACIVLIQVLKIFIPNWFTSSALLHRILVVGLRVFVRPEANWLILRHFHMGSEILDFIARNTPGVEVPLSPLRPRRIEDLRDNVFVKHDINLFNFMIRFSRELQEKRITPGRPPQIDYTGISEDFGIAEMPARWHNFIDLQTAIEIFTPVYQLFLTDNDFWRAANSLQFDETIGIYTARILQTPHHLFLVSNKHPMVPESTLRAGFRLVLHGVATESLHALLLQEKLRSTAVRT